MPLPLLGKTILITRPAQQAKSLYQLILQAGGQALIYPTIEILAAQDPKPVKATFEHIDDYNLVIFISSNAVTCLLELLNNAASLLKHTCIGAIGKATASTLSQNGLPASITPIKEFNSKGLLEQLKKHDLKGQKVLIIRGVGGKELLANSLREQGASVDYLEVYKRQATQQSPAKWVSAMKTGELSIITVSSIDALKNLVSVIKPEEIKLLLQLPIVVISQEMSQYATELGFSDTILVAENALDQSIINVLIQYYQGAKR